MQKQKIRAYLVLFSGEVFFNLQGQRNINRNKVPQKKNRSWNMLYTTFLSHFSSYYEKCGTLHSPWIISYFLKQKING